MDFSISKEVCVFLWAALTGAVLVFIYDLFRLLRKKGESSNLLVQIQDGVFWAIALFVMFAVVFSVNNGRVRFYEILGAVLGAVLYHLTLSPLVFKGISFLTEIFLKIFVFFLKILLTPLVFMYNIMYRCVNFVLRLIIRPVVRLGKGFWLHLKRAVRLVKKK